MQTLSSNPLQGIQSAARPSWGPSWRREGVAEEARTRGFPSPSFGGFGFIG